MRQHIVFWEYVIVVSPPLSFSSSLLTPSLPNTCLRASRILAGRCSGDCWAVIHTPAIIFFTRILTFKMGSARGGSDTSTRRHVVQQPQGVLQVPVGFRRVVFFTGCIVYDLDSGLFTTFFESGTRPLRRTFFCTGSPHDLYTPSFRGGATAVAVFLCPSHA